jgi:calcineurin-like phosphoesterase family protein
MKLILNPNQTLYFTSDSHYSHKNICRGVSEWGSNDKTRPYQTLEEMNDVIVNNINEVVRENDVLIHLGDWSFGGFEQIQLFRNRLNCKNIHLVLGNHDHHILRNKGNIRSIFTSVHQYLNLNVRRPSSNGEMDKYSFVLFHYPIASWDGMGDGVVHLHGHVHLPPHLRVNGRAIDVGMDGNRMYPISMDGILGIMEGRGVEWLRLPEDHHSS